MSYFEREQELLAEAAETRLKITPNCSLEYANLLTAKVNHLRAAARAMRNAGEAVEAAAKLQGEL